MEITDLFATLATVGGINGLIEGFRWWRGRKTEARRASAEVAAAESGNVRAQVDWLEKRLAERDAKIDRIYEELRAEQSAHLQDIYKLHETEIKLAESEVKKCHKRGCKDRIPPSDY